MTLSQTHLHPRTVTSTLAVYGLAHAVVDAACAALLFALLGKVTTELFLVLVVTYNVLAFGSQPLLGWMIDRLRISRGASILGVVIVAFAVPMTFVAPLGAAIVAGIGNALFHVGGGAISLNLTPHKATAPGIFVAPGAAGLLVGTFIGKSGYFTAWPFLVLMAFVCLLLYVAKRPHINYDTSTMNVRGFELVVILLLVVIAVRSFIGVVMVFPWKTDIVLLGVLTLGVVLGKAFGGVVADKAGWTRTAIVSLIVAAPLLAFGAAIPMLAIVGMFLFNVTMPITLTAIANTLPGRPGFAFGLTTLALITGVLPTFVPITTIYVGPIVVLVIIIASAALLYKGLVLYTSNFTGQRRRITR